MKSSAKRKNPEKWIIEGIALFNLKKIQRSNRYFDRILKVDPKHMDALFNKDGRCIIYMNSMLQ